MRLKLEESGIFYTVSCNLAAVFLFSIFNVFNTKFENVQFVDRGNSKPKSVGNLYLTSSYLVYVDPKTNYQLWNYYSLVSSVERLPLNTNGYPVLIRFKHFLTCLFTLSKERDCKSLCETLSRFSRPPRLQDLLCFQENSNLKFLQSIKLNKSLFELESEYARMGIPNNEWVASDLNLTYELCNTYPNIIYVPSSANRNILTASAGFRSKGRLPVLSYLHSNGASICRCAQPLTGLNARSNEDEQLMQLILKTNPNANVMYVVDTRPKINAMANKAQGKGYENENNYANTQFYFIGIENIHVMRDSLNKLIQCSEINGSSNIQFLSGLDKSDWLKHIKAVIDTSIFIMEALDSLNISVVVHCSDGWDRTAQTCALASLLLDPYYRTVHGFQILIEKEWLMFGHKFSHRLGHIYEGESTLKEISPVFSQFLECVWQVWCQFPCAFQFNERFLIKLHEHAYSCQFGTFIGNCHKDRVDLRTSETTYSLWDYMQYKLNDYINPLYIPNSAYSKKVLKPDTRPQNFKFWRGLYNRFDPNINSNEKLFDTLSLITSRTSILNDYAKSLEKSILKFKMLLGDDLQNTKTEEKLNSEKSDDQTKSIDSSFNTNSISINLDNLKSLRKTCACFDFNDFTSNVQHCSKCANIFCNICIENDGGKYIENTLKFICRKCIIRIEP